MTTCECASAENPRPPYCLGMIMPKKRLSRMYFHISGLKSLSSELTFLSSSMRQSASTGPSIKAFSSAVSFVAGKSINFFHFGAPLNKSASHHTVPASNASRSVWDIGGNTARNARRTCVLKRAARNGAIPNKNPTTTKIAHAIDKVQGVIGPINVSASKVAPMAANHAHEGAR